MVHWSRQRGVRRQIADTELDRLRELALDVSDVFVEL